MNYYYKRPANILLCGIPYMNTSEITYPIHEEYKKICKSQLDNDLQHRVFWKHYASRSCIRGCASLMLANQVLVFFIKILEGCYRVLGYIREL